MTQSNPSINAQDTVDQAARKRRATRVAWFLLLAAIVGAVLQTTLAFQQNVWPAYAMATMTILFVPVSIVALLSIRSGRTNRGMWIIVIGILGLVLSSVLLLDGIGLLFGIVIPILIVVITEQTLPVDQARRARLISLAVGVFVIIIDQIIQQLSLTYRVFMPEIQVAIPVIVVFMILGVIFFFVRQAWRGNLRVKLSIFFVTGTVTPLLVIGVLIGYQTYNNQLNQILLLESQVTKRVAEQVENFIKERESELRVLTDVRSLGNLPFDEQTALLSSLLSTQNLYDELILVDQTGQEQIYLSRLEIVTPEDLSDRRGAEEFERPKSTGDTYFGPVTFDEQTGEPRMVITIPILDQRTGKVNYTLIANFRFKTVWDLMAQADAVGSGIVYMINDDNQVVAHKNPSVVLQGTQVELPLEDAFTVGIDGTDVAMARAPITLNEQNFYVIAEQLQSEATNAAINNLIIIGVIIGLTILGATVFGTFMARLIANPIRRLATAAQAVSEGDLSQEIKITSSDEIGDLAAAFNNMTDQLRNLIASLEQQVADRTRALETSTEVSQRLSTILDQKTLVREVVEQLTTAFNYYHAHIYLFDEPKQNLVMVGGTGDAGRTMLARDHKIKAGQGLVGQAAANNEIVLIPDVSQAEGWLANPLLPDTKAEVAVPITAGNEVLGVLDVQHNIAGGIDQQDASLIQSIANQVGIAVQNAQTYQRTQQQAVREARITAISQRIQSAMSIEDVMQIAVRELGQTLDANQANIELSMSATQNEDSATRK